MLKSIGTWDGVEKTVQFSRGRYISDINKDLRIKEIRIERVEYVLNVLSKVNGGGGGRG